MKFHFANEVEMPVRAGRSTRRAAERGMALVITLIMLSVTLVMAIAFLAVANRERSSVNLSSDQANARAAADSALAAAQAQILANVLSTPGGNFHYDLLVSTNFINYYGFNTAPTAQLNPTNVNYDYYVNNTPAGLVGGVDFESVVANLEYLPRAPVMVSTNEPVGRYYLDLNRNGVFDFTGSNAYVDTITGTTNFGAMLNDVGDPQWIGVLERPDSLHSPDNHFIERYAFIAVPIGNGLDLNYMYNAAVNQTVNPDTATHKADSFFRNQGVGPWEINLAAFLTDLNTNQWDPPTAEYPTVPNNQYSYQEWLNPSFPNTGAGFDDAMSLLSWRYGFNYANQASASQIMFNAATVYPYDNIDEYSDNPKLLQTTTTNISEILGEQNQPSVAWAGADNTNRFFNLPSDLFDVAKSSTNFVDRLLASGSYTTANGAHPTYDRYTFYRMLSELGTDSSADDAGKIDLNYSNAAVQFGIGGLYTNILVSSGVVPGAQTNLVPWIPANFFAVAADRLLRTYTTNWFQNNPTNYLATYYGITGYQFPIDPATGYGFTNNNIYDGCPLGTNFIPAFSLTNIPVLVSNVFVYSPAVNRLLQLAANIYDASTNSFYPSVYKPVYTTDGNRNIYISGYEPVTSVSLPTDQNPGAQLQPPVYLNALLTLNVFPTDRNVYGVPWIIGAKKNLPNFNQFYMLNTVQLTRILQVKRTQLVAWNRNNSQYFSTNQLFIMSVTNQIGFSLWNSYATNYSGSPTIVVNDALSMTMSNAIITSNGASAFFAYQTNINQTVSQTWPGAAWDPTADPNSRQAAANSFFYGNWTFSFLPVSAYQYGTGGFIPLIDNPTFDPTVLNLPNFPQTQLMTTNGIQAFIVDGTHVIDYVQLGGPNNTRYINNELLDYPWQSSNNNQMWLTNTSGDKITGPGANQGVINQIIVSQTGPASTNTTGYGWHSPGNMPAGLQQIPQNEADYFKAFFTATNFFEAGQQYVNTDYTNQAPYTPTRTMYNLTLWQANDPLVHYLASDLTESNSYTGDRRTDDPLNVLTPMPQVIQNALGHGSSTIGDDRYQPWGRISQLAGIGNADHNQFNLAYRDPLAYGSDNWDFPGNKYPTVGWLGRVHRGTPWQTVYLKATNILAMATTNPVASGSWTWQNWSGDFVGFDATNSAPNQDTVLFDIFTTAPDDNASRGTLSVNQQHLAAWSAILSGVTVISNATPNPGFSLPPVQTNLVINPGGLDTNSPLWRLVEGANGINATRQNLFGNGGFTHVGDIVHVQALTEASPYLNNGDGTHQQYDVSDEMYEQIPQNILGLLRVSQTPRYMIYCYGQALRPAQDGTALDLNHNGLVTNYQVVAESDARAIISVHPHVTTTVQPLTGNIITVTNYTATVENYTVLPPN